MACLLYGPNGLCPPGRFRPGAAACNRIYLIRRCVVIRGNYWIVAGINFMADLQAVEKVMPAVRPLDHPAVSFLPPLPCGGGHAAMADVGDVTSPLRRESDVVIVITLIGAQVLFNRQWRRPGDGQRIQCRSKMDLVMVVGSRQCYSQGDSLTIDDEVAFCAELSPVGRVLARFIPPLPVRRPSHCPVTAASRDALAAVMFQQTELAEFGKNPRLGPFLEMLMGCGTGAVLAWKHFLLASGPQDIQDSVEDGRMGRGWSPSFGRACIFGQEGSDLGPRLIWDIAPARFPWQWLPWLGVACHGWILQHLGKDRPTP